MERAVQFGLTSDELTQEEWIQYIKHSRPFMEHILLFHLIHHFDKDVIALRTKEINHVIVSRTNIKKVQKSYDTIDKLPFQLINECASYLDRKSCAKFRLINRPIFASVNQPTHSLPVDIVIMRKVIEFRLCADQLTQNEWRQYTKQVIHNLRPFITQLITSHFIRNTINNTFDIQILINQMSDIISARDNHQSVTYDHIAQLPSVLITKCASYLDTRSALRLRVTNRQIFVSTKSLDIMIFHVPFVIKRIQSISPELNFVSFSFYHNFLTFYPESKSMKPTLIKFENIERIICIPQRNKVILTVFLKEKTTVNWRKSYINYFAVSFEDVADKNSSYLLLHSLVKKKEEIAICNLNTSLSTKIKRSKENIFCRAISHFAQKNIDRHDNSLYRNQSDSSMKYFFEANFNGKKVSVYPLRCGLLIVSKTRMFVSAAKVRYYECVLQDWGEYFLQAWGEYIRQSFDIDIVVVGDEEKEEDDSIISLTMIDIKEISALDSYFKQMRIGRSSSFMFMKQVNDAMQNVEMSTKKEEMSDSLLVTEKPSRSKRENAMKINRKRKRNGMKVKPNDIVEKKRKQNKVSDNEDEESGK